MIFHAYRSSIRAKLVLSMAVTSTIGLLIASISFVFLEVSETDELISHRLDTQARIIGTTSTPALIAQDVAGTRKILAALEAEPAIIAAGIYRPDGERFTTYLNASASPAALPERLADDQRQPPGSIGLQHAIDHQGRTIGTLYILASAEARYQRFREYSAITAGILLLSLFTTMIASRRLQRTISAPIEHLAEIARRVSSEKNYALRATRYGDDELGDLTEIFNNMLARIEDRDLELGMEVIERNQELNTEIDERRQIESLLRHITEGVSDDIGEQFFYSLVRHLAQGLGETHAFVGVLDQETRLHINVMSGVSHHAPMQPFRFALRDTPCASVLQDGARVYPTDIQTLFPGDESLAELGVDSFAAAPLRDTSGKNIGLLVVMGDRPMTRPERNLSIIRLFAIRTTAELQHQLNEAELRKLSRAVEQSPSVVVITDPGGNIEYVNPKFSELTGYTPEEVKGRVPSFLKHRDTSPQLYLDMRRTILDGREWHGEFLNRKKNGQAYWASVSVTLLKNPDGVVTHFLITQEDITRARKLSEKLAHQASHDALTGLVNRPEFELRMQRALDSARSGQRMHGLCYIDLDQFKVINDTCGHDAGDALLEQVATTLAGRIRQQDTLARLGGDEFGVLMERCPLKYAERVAQSMCNALENCQFAWKDKRFRLTGSIGLVRIDSQSESVSDLLRMADAACYAAKEGGRNRYHLHHMEDETLARRHGEMQWVAHINEALERDRLCLFAQPIIDIKNPDGQTWNRCEMLIRMITENGDLIAPGAFLGAAEHYSLSPRIDHWVFEHTLQWLASERRFLEQLSFCSINLSSLSITEGSFLDFIVARLRHYAIPKQKICFEITETAAISNLANAHRFIDILRKHGCLFALDDFGSGLSSFAYLKNLSVDLLKIDGQFVRDMLSDPIDMAMVKSINEIGQVMGKRTIAEFVEDEATLTALKTIGVDFAQGFATGRPVAIQELNIMNTATIHQLRPN